MTITMGPPKRSSTVARRKPDVSPCLSKLPRHRLVELLWSFAPAYQRWSESLLVEKGLSPQRLRILGSIHERGPRIMSDLKTELGVTATNVTALVDSLEKDGLVIRTRHPTDRRATVIELTQEGREKIAEGYTEYVAVTSELFSVLSEEDQWELIRLMDLLYDGLEGKAKVSQ